MPPTVTPQATRCRLTLLLVAVSSVVCLTSAFAVGPPQQDQRPAQTDRWEAAIQAFEVQDRQNPPPQDAVVFAGASLIRRWDLAQSFPDLTTIHRGFGGSQLADLLRYAERIVIPYKPRVVVFFGGDNDLNAGVSPQQVASSVEQIVAKLRTALPHAKLVFIPPRPCLARWDHIDKIRAANKLIEAYCAKNNVAFVDISSQILGKDGRPRPEIFVEDGLHFTPEGYRILAAAVQPHLD